MVEEFCAQSPFQTLDVMTDCGLGEIQLFRCFGEMQVLGSNKESCSFAKSTKGPVLSVIQNYAAQQVQALKAFCYSGSAANGDCMWLEPIALCEPCLARYLDQDDWKSFSRMARETPSLLMTRTITLSRPRFRQK